MRGGSEAVRFCLFKLVRIKLSLIFNRYLKKVISKNLIFSNFPSLNKTITIFVLETAKNMSSLASLSTLVMSLAPPSSLKSIVARSWIFPLWTWRARSDGNMAWKLRGWEGVVEFTAPMISWVWSLVSSQEVA